MSKEINIERYRTASGSQAGSSGGNAGPGADYGTGVSKHSELKGVICTADNYSDSARDLHLTATEADKLKALSEIQTISSDDIITIPTDQNIYTALRSQQEDDKIREEMDGRFIRKDQPDTTDYRVDFRDGATFGSYTEGFTGDGAVIDKDGNAEMTSLRLRDFLEVPELRFNRIDVVSGELWNAVAFGLIDEVDEGSRIARLRLEEGELSGLHVNDFCRGIFHNLDGNSATAGTDAAGFDTIAGFSTSYFTPVEIISGDTFRYELKPGSTVHPCKAMKFAVYGNPVDKERQHSAYHTRAYTRYLRGVDTWKIESRHISMQLGDLSGLSIDGQSLGEGSVYLNNVYFGGKVWTVPGLDNGLKGQDAYSVTLSAYSAVFNVEEGLSRQLDVATGDAAVCTGSVPVVASEFRITTRIQAAKGPTPLRYSDVAGEGKYVVSAVATGCTYTLSDGVIAVNSVTADKAEIRMTVNCEGVSTYEQVFTIVRVANGQNGQDGQDGQPGCPGSDGSNGTNGSDGKTTYLYYRCSPGQPTTPQGFPPYGWGIDPPSGSDPLWVSKIIFNGNGSIYSNWSVPVRISGNDGTNGSNGADGKQGPATVFRGLHVNGKQYTGNTSRVEIVYTLSGSTKTFYQTLPTAGVFRDVAPPNSSKWAAYQGQFESIATGFAFIEEANISGWRFKENYIESQNNNVVLDGSANADPRITLGATYANRNNAPFKVFEDGRFEATKGTIGPWAISVTSVTLILRMVK